MDFENFKIDDSGPVYLQVVRFFKRKILAGEVSVGDVVTIDIKDGCLVAVGKK